MLKAQYICDKIHAQTSAMLNEWGTDQIAETLGVNYALAGAAHYRTHLWHAMGAVDGEAKLVEDIKSGRFYNLLLTAIGDMRLEYQSSLLVGIHKGISVFKSATLGQCAESDEN